MQAESNAITKEGAAWSSGGSHQVAVAGKIANYDDLDIALAAATGVSAGAAHTVPSIFFQHSADVLKTMKNLASQPDEKVSDVECYVVEGTVAGQKLVLWITKDFLLKQRRHILGGEMTIPVVSDEGMKKGLAALGKPPTDKEIAQMKETMLAAKKMSSGMKGSITETSDRIELNPVFTKESFESPASSTGLR